MKHDFAVSRAKLVDYLLDLNHPRGRSKALFLAAFGFNAEHVDALAEALLAHRRLEPVSIRVNAWGTRYVMEGPIEAPDGRSPRMRTIWQTASADDIVAQFVTAYPVK